MEHSLLGAAAVDFLGETAVMQFPLILKLIGHSSLLGIILAGLTFIANRSFSEDQEDRLKLFVGSLNILFLTIGLTAIMILVNNNLARAFAIGASLALFRLRVKMSNRKQSTNVLFGIIAGLACGVQEIALAYLISAIYIFFQVILIFIIRYQQKKAKRENRPAPTIGSEILASGVFYDTTES